MAGRNHKLDFIIVGVILVLAVAGFVGVRLYGAHNSADIVKITGPDGMLVELPLDEDTRYVVETDLGTNTVVVENATVHIEDADCKNHDCMDQGTITRPGQQLICLPHKLVVQIVSRDVDGSQDGSAGDDGSSGFDAVSR
jgi:hypothetical protein